MLILLNICVELEFKFDIWENLICFNLDLIFDFLIFFFKIFDRSCYNCDVVFFI